jgi:hypothetical protein
MATTATYKGVTYANGKVPSKFLAPLDGNNLALASDPAVLREDAAASWNRARAEVLAKTGIELTVRGWNRSLADQEKFFFQRYRKQATGGTDVRWYKGARYVRFTGAPAAIPGTSNHGLGLAVDVTDFGAAGTAGNARRAASIAILKRHGWTDDEGRSIAEPWHLVYDPARDTQKHVTPPKEEFLMALSDDAQKKLAKQVGEIRTIAEQTRTKVTRLEADAAERHLADLKRHRALAAVVDAVAKNQDPAAAVAAVRDALKGVEITLTTKE